MDIGQYLRLPTQKNAIKEATISLFFASPFVHAEALNTLLLSDFESEFNQIQKLQNTSLRIKGPFEAPGELVTHMQETGSPGVLATWIEEGFTTRLLQVYNDTDRVSLSLHSLRYERWADFLALFQRLTDKLAPLLANMVVLATSLHYVDEMQWTHLSQPLPLKQLYQENAAYFPTRFFEGSESELLLTVATELDGLPFYDRLHITSLTNNRPTATISHYMVHQYAEAADLATLLAGSNLLLRVLERTHAHNKTLLRNILQPEIQILIGLNA